MNAYRLPGATDRIALAVLGLGVILLVAGLARSASAAPARAPATGALVLGLCGLALLVWASGLRPGGATGLLAAGLVVAAGQLALVWVLALRQSSGAALDALALHRPARHWLWAPCVAAGLCALVPVVLQRLVPPTGEAPVEVAIAWPSGKLAFAALGLVVPVAEEVFFRGFVYSALRARLSGPLAVLAASALFALAHVPQSFGDWASLGAIASTGLVLTLLRHLSGALWPSIAAHLLYNGALVLLAWS